MRETHTWVDGTTTTTDTPISTPKYSTTHPIKRALGALYAIAFLLDGVYGGIVTYDIARDNDDSGAWAAAGTKHCWPATPPSGPASHSQQQWRTSSPPKADT